MLASCPLVLDDGDIVIHYEYTEDPKNNDPNSDAKANNDGNNDMGTSDVELEEDYIVGWLLRSSCLGPLQFCDEVASSCYR